MVHRHRKPSLAIECLQNHQKDICPNALWISCNGEVEMIKFLGVERNQYQDNLQGQEFLHIYFEQVHVQGIQIQVPEFLAGKSRENPLFL